LNKNQESEAGKAANKQAGNQEVQGEGDADHF